MKRYNALGLLSGSDIKLIACFLMAVDHVGYHIFPHITLLRIIGRLSLPMFAFFVSEGCRYTRNKVKHFMLIFISGIIFLFGVKIFDGIWFGNIFLQFSISVLYIYLLQWLKDYVFDGDIKKGKICGAAGLFFVSVYLGYIFLEDVKFDYNFFATLMPVIISVTDLREYTDEKWVRYVDNIYVKMLVTFIALLPLCITVGSIQWFSILSLPVLMLYNGKAGNKKLKYFFYLFYPLHVIIILAVKILIG